MPYVYRFLPERWVTFLDPILYPTCPVKIPEAEKKDKNKEEETEKSCCAATGNTEETKKDQ